ncbi:hypothetical protein [Alkalihalobacillus trypoxylicola]|uniref:hypothetical protein n=1 Tax=Alkalihalobacillus trypoxylicola TaxID=519424 RepID=UPI000A5B5448|nr:hypothetical protein [Alkalihalobacillus trypoxylicola]
MKTEQFVFLISTLGRCFPKGLSSANSDYAKHRQSGFSNGADPLGVTTTVTINN